MKNKFFKIASQIALICVVCVLLWTTLSRSFILAMGMEDVELGFHGNLALIITVTFGFAVGVGLVGAFFYFARKQTAEEE